MDEDEIIKTRLLYKTSVVGKSSAQKCAEHLLSCFDARSKQQTEESEYALHLFEWELEKMTFDAEKALVVQSTCARELKANADSNRVIGSDIAKIKGDIEQLKKDLVMERCSRKYREEYESLAKVVNTIPSRMSLEGEMKKETDEMQALQAELNATNSKMETRSKQFDLLLRTIHDLQQTLKEDFKDQTDEMDTSDEESVHSP